MGTFADTANVDYHVSFAESGKQTSVFRFPCKWNSVDCPFVYKERNRSYPVANGLANLPTD
jgi:hypothetical protein